MLIPHEVEALVASLYLQAVMNDRRRMRLICVATSTASRSYYWLAPTSCRQMMKYEGSLRAFWLGLSYWFE